MALHVDGSGGDVGCRTAVVSSLGDRKLWACATLVIDQHGGDAELFVAIRPGACVEGADDVGVATWRAVAGRVDAMRRPAAA